MAFGEGLTSSFAGKPTSFEVEGFDKRGQPRVNGGDKYSGEMLQLDPEPGKEPARVELIFKVSFCFFDLGFFFFFFFLGCGGSAF